MAIAVPKNAKYMRVVGKMSDLNSQRIRVPGYPEFYFQAPEMKSVPNAKDSIEWFEDEGVYKFVERVKKYVLTEYSIKGIYLSYWENLDLLFLQIPEDSVIASATGNFSTLVYLPEYSRFGNQLIGDELQFENVYYYGSYFGAGVARQVILMIPKGTYTTLAEAQAALAGTIIYYQLATPIYTTLTPAGSIVPRSTGSMFIENYKKETFTIALDKTLALPLEALSVDYIELSLDGFRLSPDTYTVSDLGLATAKITFSTLCSLDVQIAYEVAGTISGSVGGYLPSGAESDARPMRVIPPVQLGYGKVEDINAAFSSCPKLKDVESIALAKSKDCSDLFKYDVALTLLPGLDFISSLDNESAFYGCTNLATLNDNTINTGWRFSTTVSFVSCPLTYDSVILLISRLQDSSGQILTISQTSRDFFTTAEWTVQQGIAESAGWSISNL